MMLGRVLDCSLVLSVIISLLRSFFSLGSLHVSWDMVLSGLLLPKLFIPCLTGRPVLISSLQNLWNFIALWIALAVASNSNAWFGTAVLVTNMRNFPLSRGTVSGILKGYVRISAAVYTVLYSSMLEKSASKLLLFLSLGIPVICLALMYFIRPCAPPSGEDSLVHVHFLFTQAASVLLAIYLLVLTVLYDTVTLSGAVSYVLLAIALLFLLSPLGILVKMTLFRANSGSFTPLVVQ
ncbi:Detected protein of unknown function [Hibiscus syriacus]|uniref:Nodulin-like domain-containing protein n=1 Tax=Hibiscus syriacus TaxID=106335 RepID=A0A6A3D4S9_HIBSY|nr:Detected protein of unknown function [Hibiscus syriacus]